MSVPNTVLPEREYTLEFKSNADIVPIIIDINSGKSLDVLVHKVVHYGNHFKHWAVFFTPFDCYVIDYFLPTCYKCVIATEVPHDDIPSAISCPN